MTDVTSVQMSWGKRSVTRYSGSHHTCAVGHVLSTEPTKVGGTPKDTPPDENCYKNSRNLQEYPQERMSPKSTTINVLLFSSIALSSGLLSLGQVGPDSKAGLAWPNGPWTDIQQYTTTGKVSWCVCVSQTSCQTGNKLETLTGTTLGVLIL
jgi:hypothetical protein